VVDEAFMRAALAQGGIAAGRGDPGFGAVVVRDGELVAAAASAEVSERAATAHDGISVVGLACRRLGRPRLEDGTFSGTAEPCPMCSAALLQARVARIVLGAGGSALAAILGPRSLLIEDLAADYGSCPRVARGLLAEPALSLLARSLQP
jgi:tRNA(Arg) A34 adenosine deaminase TadA